RAVDFTAWDPSAKTDMQALARIFDTNHNGKLDPGDVHWKHFKVLVSNTDGSKELKALGELGIALIDLITDKQRRVLADGSRIEGFSSYTRTDGTKGIAADVALTYARHEPSVLGPLTAAARSKRRAIERELTARVQILAGKD